MLKLHPQPPFDFDKIRRRQQGVGHELYRFEGERMFRTIRVNGRVYFVEISSAGTVDRPELHIMTAPEPSDPNEIEALKHHLSRMLSADLDLTPFYKYLEQDPLLAQLGVKFRGLRIMLESDPFECMAKTIIGQQLNLAFAAELTRRLIRISSAPFAYQGQLVPVFPSAEEVASLSYEQLRAEQFSQRKAEYLIDFARLVADGRLDLGELVKLDDDAVIEKLVKLRGIGRWTAECFLLFGMGRTDLLPAADIGLRNGIRKLHAMGAQPTEEEVRRIGADWSPWSSYVTYYLWEYLNQP
ncbi:DNA-3-methyladenine glycosylase family protein [Paenibacillus hamazuiensis]|uniref:DNA-3-methyladenine glycosylase family protein n=1 Tax=Paenibacillus hamazuiensis TaxID=2936508 RepID=UPI00200BC335|nr:DNA-3-methyladenine glycosylase [Paenibacillus hamazuiensis]